MTNNKTYRILYCTICLTMCMVLIFCGCQIHNKIDQDSPNGNPIPDIILTEEPETGDSVSAPEKDDIPYGMEQAQSPTNESIRESKSFSAKNNGLETFTVDDLYDKYLYYSYEAELVANDLLYPRIDGAAQISPIIVIGEIVDLYYTDNIQTYWTPCFTIYDVKISQVLRGDFVAGDIISVEEQGGYIRGVNVHTMRGGPLDASCYVQVDLFGGAPEPAIGEKYILFLENSDEIPKTYSVMGAYTGKYIIDENNIVSRFLKEDEFWTYGTLDEAIATINENSFNEERYLNLDANTYLNTPE